MRGDFTPPRVTLSLDDPAAHRWDAIIARFNATIWAAVAEIEQDPTYKVGLALAAKIPWHGDYLPPEHWEEIQAISRVSNIPAGTLLMLNILYDLTTFDHSSRKACTSIVAATSDGSPVHGRNLDYGLVGAMKNITAIIDWQSGGKTVFSSVSFLGTVNFNTVVRAGGWSLSHDERDAGPLIEDLLDTFLRQRVVTFSMIRELAASAPSYAAALSRLSEAELDAPSYFILAGIAPGEGAVLTRDRDGLADAYTLQPAADPPRWYVLETNYDRWAQPDADDNRRAVAERSLAAAGGAAASLSAGGLWSVLSQTHCNASAGERPTLNSETVYTALMQPGAAGDPLLRVKVRDPSPPVQCLP